ncbi:ribosome maturation factor RimP [Desulfolucanica intricata]|uniref:ribosome maturation factor RimP n=1 Tax=Desulfolucanica intricata TaxID=1285191 RepID=UPI00082FF4F2|nr:ribosome maturation factor RimP [Desulfolucanica intricata]
MTKNKVVNLVEELVAPIASRNGVELVDVEYTKEGSQWYLRVFLDKPGGINLDDCQAVSQELSELLDKKDPIPQAYTLEVSSSGLDRPLKKPSDYERFRGHKIELTTYAPLDGKKKFSGRLKGLEEKGIVLHIDGAEYVIPVEQVASARLAVEF